MITVCTASLPERAELLAEAVASVNAQSVPVVHLIGVDHLREGAPKVYNRLASAVETEWVSFLDDDDLLDPDHVATLTAHLSEDVDVVYTGCRADGHNFGNYNRPFDPKTLERLSVVPITACVRVSAFRDVYGFPPTQSYDWDLWKTLSRAGARFLSVPRITWTYRLRRPSSSYGDFLNGVLSG